MFHPAIPDEGTWSMLGEHGESGEHGEHGKQDDLKHSNRDSKRPNCQPDDSKHSILWHLS